MTGWYYGQFSPGPHAEPPKALPPAAPKVAPAPPVAPPVAPPKAVKTPQQRRRARTSLSVGLGIVLVVVGGGIWQSAKAPNSGPTTSSMVGVGGGLVAVGVVLVLLPAVIWWCRVNSRWWKGIYGPLSQPMPTPAQIGAQLEAEWGRPATVVEVAAVHQMLQSERNQALLKAGASTAALYLMDRTRHST